MQPPSGKPDSRDHPLTAPPWAALAMEIVIVAAAPALLQLARYFSWGAGAYRLCTLLGVFAIVALFNGRQPRLSSVFTHGWARGVLIASASLLVALQARVFVTDISAGQACITDMGRPTICAGEWLLRGMNPWAECLVKHPRALAPAKKVAKRPPRAKPAHAAAKPAHAATKPAHAAAKPATAWGWCAANVSCIDRKAGHAYANWAHHGGGYDFMDGYKYGPLMALLYMPATHIWIERGIYVTNALLWLAVLVLLARLAALAYPALPCAPWRALLLFSLPATVPFWWKLPRMQFVLAGTRYPSSSATPGSFLRELTLTCSNDVVPVTLLLVAVLLAARRRSLLSGVFCGLSLATKQLPAPLIAVLLVGLEGVSWRRFLLGTVCTAGALYLPILLWSPREALANLVLFGALRPTNNSSIRAYLPGSYEPLVSLLQLAVIAGLVWMWLRAPRRDLAALLRTAALVVIVFVALNKVVHANYILWIQPLVALSIAGWPFAPTALRTRESTVAPASCPDV